MAEKKRVCVVGAGPSGMSTLYHFDKINDPNVEVVCYEKSNTWGGMWNFTWLTGTDSYGEPCHNGMYKFLWSNGPKESHEYPDYTFEEHFGKPIGSFPPRPVVRDYMEGRFTKKARSDLKKYIAWNTVVRLVRYNKETDDFTAIVENLNSRHVTQEKFTHVVCATGIFNFPNKPTFPGIDSFVGRIIHSHDFRDGREFKDQRVLVVGSSYSAEDIAMQVKKFGAKSVVTSYRRKPMGFNFPEGIKEHPIVTIINGNTVAFKDGSSAEVDSIILSTGYLYHFPYMNDDIRLQSKLSMYPSGLYKGALWLEGGNNKLFYIGVQNQYFSYNMFDINASWVSQFITGKVKNEPISHQQMVADAEKWAKRASELQNPDDEIDFQADYIKDLCTVTGYNPDVEKGRAHFHKWLKDKQRDILSYREQPFVCLYTGNMSGKQKPWYTDYDDSIEAFIN